MKFINLRQNNKIELGTDISHSNIYDGAYIGKIAVKYIHKKGSIVDAYLGCKCASTF